jgi:carbamoylphosphate synthase large subunit
MQPQTILLDSEERRQRALSIIQRIGIAKPLEVEIRPHVTRRSGSQNARLWKLHTLAGEVTGYSAEEMHEHALCRHFGFAEVERKNPITGQTEIARKPLKRSSARDKKEFAAFMEATEVWYVDEFQVWLE